MSMVVGRVCVLWMSHSAATCARRLSRAAVVNKSCVVLDKGDTGNIHHSPFNESGS